MNTIRARRIFEAPGGGGSDPTLSDRVTVLENNEYKVAYFAEISSDTGTITKPTGSTILADQFPGGVDAYVSTISSGQPTGENPVTAAGVLVDVTSFDTSGNYTLTGVPSAYPVALIYIIKIPAISWSNLDLDNTLEYEKVNTTFLDNQFTIKDNADQTKKLAFQASTIPTATTVTLTSPATSGTLALTSDLTNAHLGSITFIISGRGGVISTGYPDGGMVTIPYACTITGWNIEEITDTPISSSIVVDTWKDTYANYPPTVADTIWGGSKPTLSSTTKNQATGLSIAVAAQDILKISVDSVTSAVTVKLTIFITKT